MLALLKKIFFFFLLFYCLSPWGNSTLALFFGVTLAFLNGNPYTSFTKKYTSQLLQISVVGLGAGMNLKVIAIVGFHGIGHTVISIFFTILVGYFLFKVFQQKKIISLLITVGTAICGGSAIAAIGPIVYADDESMSLSLAVIFILNAIALFTFPFLGHFFSLTEHQFGLWSALAIHDTSSVVGASMQYGKEALQYATTVKLARALWIIPISLILAFSIRSKSKIKIPWFIFGFILTAALATWFPILKTPSMWLSQISKKFLILTLFFIGINLNFNSLKKIGFGPLLFGFILWIIVGSSSLWAIKLQWLN